MKAISGAVLAAALLMPAGLARAQALPDPEANIVEELVVQAVEPGPAWWRVSDGDSTVYIMGVADDRIPGGVGWDRRWLDKRLKGANALIIGTRVGLTANLRDIPGALRMYGKLKSQAPVEQALPEPLRARFTAMRDKLGQPASRYDGWMPLIAGQRLVNDAAGRDLGPSITQTVIQAAKRSKVPVVDPARYDGMPFVRKAVDSLTPELQQRCMAWALDDAEAPASRRRAAAEGWARGDLAGALTEPRSFDRCVLLLGGGAELWSRARDDRTAAIVKALDKPGHAVALVSLRQLLAEDGLLVALQARGLKVRGPGEAD